VRIRFYTTGTPILHVEASFNSVERGLRRGISSWTSLKHCIHFSFILKLTIFIYKQLKRPVAFSAVHNHKWQLTPMGSTKGKWLTLLLTVSSNTHTEKRKGSERCRCPHQFVQDNHFPACLHPHKNNHCYHFPFCFSLHATVFFSSTTFKKYLTFSCGAMDQCCLFSLIFLPFATRWLNPS